MPYNKCLEQGSVWSRCSINISWMNEHFTNSFHLVPLMPETQGALAAGCIAHTPNSWLTFQSQTLSTMSCW